MPSGKFINLCRKVFKESDFIIDSLSNNGEKFSFRATNALKSQRRFPGGVLEPLNFVELFYTKSRSGFLNLKEAKLIYDFYGLRQNYKKLETGLYFLKLLKEGSREGLSDNKSLFDLLGNSLKTLEKIENCKPNGFDVQSSKNSTNTKDDLKYSNQIKRLKLHFKIKYLYYLGFLSPDSDTKEFIETPVNKYDQIGLSEKKFIHIDQMISKQIKETL